MIETSEQQFNMFPAHIGLRKYVQYYNIVFPMNETYTEHYTLMPDACGTLSLAYSGDSIHVQLWGASQNPVMLGTEPVAYCILLLIQLTPVGLFQITGQNQAEFAGKRLNLGDIDIQLERTLLAVFESSKTVEELADACEAILYQRMEKPIVSDAIVHATAVISMNHGQITVSDIAKQVCYSERQLNRLFLSQVGMNIKNYARLVRFNYVLQQIQTSPCLLGTLSQQAGYFDQAHMDKDFKAISGITPQNYVKSMSDFYYDG